MTDSSGAAIPSGAETKSTSLRHIELEPRPTCLLCGMAGRALYDNLKDWLFDVPGKWKLSCCTACGIAWLDPTPAPKDISKLYARYYTHATGEPSTWLTRIRAATHQQVLARMGYTVDYSSRLLPRLLSYVPSINRAAVLDVLSLPTSATGTLLDVGCGNGEFGARMRSFGWTVSGVDPDSTAIAQARSKSLEVFTGSIEDVPTTSHYDVITLNHVIEHADDPVNLLSECRKRLSPKGRVIVTTPNLKSLGHRWFKANWRGLEVPRHLVLFSEQGLRRCVERAGLEIDTMRTETRLARMIYCPSVCAKEGGHDIGEQRNFRVRTKIGSYVFQTIEDALTHLANGIGEELFCVGTAPGVEGTKS
jgi:2-polyprenyl-3-methyl-5-hydroxy-6-metoxy-1,4-benzoquinol methylase